MLLNTDFETKLKIGYIGTGPQSYRHILPCLRYLPVELVAIADHNAQRGVAVARQFGAQRFYPNHKALLAKEKVDAVFMAVGPDELGRPRYPELAADALGAGFHCWVDGPPCSTSNEVRRYTDACLRARKYASAGLPRMFAPAYVKLSEILAQPVFGGVTSYSLRYPLVLPGEAERSDERAGARFLQFAHPYSILLRLFGEAEGLTFSRNPTSGGAVINLTYRSGVVGVLHLTAGQSAAGPTERLEVIGRGASAVVEDGQRLTYYRPVAGGADGWGLSEVDAPLTWRADLAAPGQMDASAWLSGYVGCLSHFIEQTLADRPPRYGNLVDMLHIMIVIDRLRAGKANTWIVL